MKRLKVIAGDQPVVVPRRRFFTVGAPSLIDPYGEVLPLLSHVHDDLARFVISTAPSTSWGHIAPPPLVFTLPHRVIAPRDGVFLVTGDGVDRTEPHPEGRGVVHLVHLRRSDRLWSGPSRPHIYRLDAKQK